MDQEGSQVKYCGGPSSSYREYAPPAVPITIALSGTSPNGMSLSSRLLFLAPLLFFDSLSQLMR